MMPQVRPPAFSDSWRQQLSEDSSLLLDLRQYDAFAL